MFFPVGYTSGSEVIEAERDSSEGREEPQGE